MRPSSNQLRHALDGWEKSFGTGERHTIAAEAMRELLRQDDATYPHEMHDFTNWLDFTDRVARPLVDPDSEMTEAEALALFRRVSPYYLCVALVMAANRVRKVRSTDHMEHYTEHMG